MTIAINQQPTVLVRIISQNEDKILAEWIQEMSDATRRSDLINNADIRIECATFLRLVRDALDSSGVDDVSRACGLSEY